MTNYVEFLLGKKDESIFKSSLATAKSFFKPFIDAMFLEGSYWIKAPCYNESTINPDTPKVCMRGSPWVE